MTQDQCPICEREMSPKNSNLHHLIPRLKGGKVDDCIRLHVICHSKLHSLWSEGELRDYYNTVERILTDDQMIAFVKWVSKKHPNYGSAHTHTNKQSNSHKKRRKR